MSGKDYDPDWTIAAGWTVTCGTGPGGLKVGSVLKFEGDGKGGTACKVKLSGADWGTGAKHDDTFDFVDLEVGGVAVQVLHDTSTTPATIRCGEPCHKGSGGGSWTAEDGSSGFDHERHPRHRRRRPAAAPNPSALELRG